MDRVCKLLNAHADFFALFDGFAAFMEFFRLQELVTPGFDEVRFYVPRDNFERSGTPPTKEEYVTYRERALEFIAARNGRMAEWVEGHP
jgi:hypothetical protein